MGNFLGLEEMNNNCKKKTHMEWRMKVSLHKFILHVTSLLTQKSKHLIFLLPFLHRVVLFRNVIHFLTP